MTILSIRKEILLSAICSQLHDVIQRKHLTNNFSSLECALESELSNHLYQLRQIKDEYVQLSIPSQQGGYHNV